MKKKLLAFLLTIFLTFSAFALTFVSVSSATYIQDGDWKYEKPSATAQYYYIEGYIGKSSSIRIPALFQTKPVTKINNDAFLNNIGLSYVEIPATVKIIGMNAFYGCASLETVNIPRSVTEIGPNAFYGCTLLTNVKFSEDTALTSIPRNCFSGCASLKEVTIPQGVTAIYDRAFYECTYLTDVIINPSVTEISANAFDGIANLTIRGWSGTYAQQYAQDNNIPFISLGDNPYPTVTTTTIDETCPTSSVTSTTGQESVPTTSSFDEVIPTYSTEITTTATTTVTQTTTTPGQVYLIGDSDLSGKVTVKDATVIQKYAAGLLRLDRTQLFLANCDGTGGVNVKDATQIQKYCAAFKNILFVGTEVIF